MNHIPRERFGQHFLVDRHYIRKIIDAINPQSSDLMVEIGPGLGAMTNPLLEKLDHLHVVEIDRDIVSQLEANYSKNDLAIHAQDALQFDFGAIGERFRVVGNLPYNISSPLLFHLAAFKDKIIDMTFMLQKEVVDRMVAAPSTSDYGRLSVMLQSQFDMERLFIVPPGAFNPPPKVDSAIVRMIPLLDNAPRPKNEKTFAMVVTAAFSQRRKTLRNTLKNWMVDEDFNKLEVDSQARAENLSTEDFIRVADYVFDKRHEGST
jgi:16S rRNA (adenine1518-N6/adenine1519-N6)-dimethyltransferase